MAPESMSSLLGEAATLMVTGMAFVFAFLALLIGGVRCIAWYCEKFPGEEPAAAPVRSRAAPTAKDNTVSAGTIAAIAAAVHQHRNNQK